MKTEEAIEFIELYKYERHSYDRESDQKKIDEVVSLLKSNQELITKFSSEGDEYQKRLNRIDELALLIGNATEQIRNNI